MTTQAVEKTDTEQMLRIVHELFADAPKGFEATLQGTLREVQSAP